MRPIKRAFWIEFWLEKTQRKNGRDIGIIKEVMDKKEQRISDFYDIIDFIIPYIENMDIKINWYWRFFSWLRQMEQRHAGRPSANDDETKDTRIDS